MNFLCFDTEDNSKELMTLASWGVKGASGFGKAVTQFAAITASGEKFYVGCDVKPNKTVKRIFAHIAANKPPLKLSRADQCEVIKHTVLQRAMQPKLIRQAKQWLQKRQESHFYALNIQYDLGNLFADQLDELDTTLVGGRVIKSVWHDKTFVDVFNIWPMSVKKLGEAFGLAKLETSSMATDQAYVFRDVEIIRQAMLFAWQFCQPLGVDTLPPTLGGLCVKVWKALGGVNCHDSNALSRAAYYGGRVELFKVCNDATWALNDPEKVYAVFNKNAPSDLLKFPRRATVCWTDINSLYPSVMLQEFPGEMEDFGTTLPPFGVARVRVRVPKTDLCVLPWRSDDGEIFYPWGRFEGSWTIAELMAAKKRGAVIEKVFEAFGSEESFKPYNVFVEKLYAARLASTSDAEKLFFKLLMNNLYGRLGNGGTIGRTVWQTEKNKLAGVPFGNKVLVQYQMPLGDETNWCHAAHVTAYGRLALLEFIEKVGVANMIYCDTDSCIFDCPDKKIPFPVGSALGQMKLEGWEKACVTFAPKMYRAGDRFKAKGVPRHLAKDYINHGRAEFDLPFKMREAIRFYDRHNSHRLSVWRRVEKFNRQSYTRKQLKGSRFYPCQKTQVG